MTASAQRIIQPITLQTLAQNPVGVDLWAEENGWQPGHIELADRADLLLVAPATAHCVAQFAHGLADLLTSLHLAYPSPSFNGPGNEWQNAGSSGHASQFGDFAQSGICFVEPDHGLLACGYAGHGKLASVNVIVAAVCDLLAQN